MRSFQAQGKRKLHCMFIAGRSYTHFPHVCITLCIENSFLPCNSSPRVSFCEKVVDTYKPVNNVISGAYFVSSVLSERVSPDPLSSGPSPAPLEPASRQEIQLFQCLHNKDLSKSCNNRVSGDTCTQVSIPPVLYSTAIGVRHK